MYVHVHICTQPKVAAVGERALQSGIATSTLVQEYMCSDSIFYISPDGGDAIHVFATFETFMYVSG